MTYFRINAVRILTSSSFASTGWTKSNSDEFLSIATNNFSPAIHQSLPEIKAGCAYPP